MPRANAKDSKGTLRNRTLGAIHAGRRQLGWDVEAYRDYLEQLVGKRSASECTDEELARILDDMRVRGFRRKHGELHEANAASVVTPSDQPHRATQLDKARAIWSDLGAIGELSNPSDVGFCRYVERMTKKSRPEWCTPEQLSKVIEGLKAWRKRAAEARLKTSTIE